mgnify:CR=1 FL=1
MCGASRYRRPRLPYRFDERPECRTVDQFEGLTFGEYSRLSRETTACDEQRTRYVFAREDTVQLANRFDANPTCLPLLALHDSVVITLREQKVDAAIASAAATFLDDIAVLPERFTHQMLEFLP